MRRIHIQANVVWTAEKASGCDRWILKCEPLGLAIEANSKDEFSGLIDEAMDLLFVDLLEDDELDQFLADRNWTKSESNPDRESGVEFDLPWQLVTKGSDGSRRSCH